MHYWDLEHAAVLLILQEVEVDWPFWPPTDSAAFKVGVRILHELSLHLTLETSSSYFKPPLFQNFPHI